MRKLTPKQTMQRPLALTPLAVSYTRQGKGLRVNLPGGGMLLLFPSAQKAAGQPGYQAFYARKEKV